MIKSRIVNWLRHFVWEVRRRTFNKKSQDRLTQTASSATIISANCTGGIIYHDLGLQFLSPTINLYIRAEDFLKFCENLRYYMSIDEFVECTDPSILAMEEEDCPVAYLGDIILFLLHYSSVEEAEKKWNDRKKRINYDNIAVIMSDRDGMTEELKDRFERLPYRKVMFTHLPDSGHKNCFYIRGFESEDCVGIVTEKTGWSGRRPVDQFDYVGFLNGEMNK